MYQEIKPRRVADEIMEQLQRMILDGMLKTGQRLRVDGNTGSVTILD